MVESEPKTSRLRKNFLAQNFNIEMKRMKTITMTKITYIFKILQKVSYLQGIYNIGRFNSESRHFCLLTFSKVN